MPYAKMPVVFQAFLFYFVILIPRFIIGRPLMRQEGVYYSESQIRHRYVNDRSRTINCGDSYLNILTAVEVCDNKRTRKTFTVMTHCKRASKCRPPLTCTSPNRALFIKYTCRCRFLRCKEHKIYKTIYINFITAKTPLNIEDDGEYRVTASNMMIAKMRCGIDRYLDIISAVYGYGFYESGEVVPMNIVNDVRRLCQKKEACSFVQDFRHNKEFKGKDNFALIEFQCKKDTETCYSVVCPVHSHCVEGKKGPQCICDPGCVLENGVCVDKTIYLDESFKNLSLEHSTIWIPDQVDEITDNVDKLVDNTGSDADVRGVETDKETGTVVLNTDDSDFTTSFDLIENDEEYLDSENSDANEISNPPSVEELGIHQGIDHREYMEDITDKNNMNNNTNVLDDEMLHNDQHEKENGFIMVDQKDKTEISMGTKLDEDGSGEMNENINHDNRNLHNEVEKRDNDVNDTNDNSRIEHKKIDVKENSQDNQKESSSSNAIVNDNQLNSPTDIDAKIGELVDFNSSIVRGNNVGTEETNATGSMDTIINSRLNTNDESHASYTAVSQGKPTNDTYEDHTSVGTPDNGHSNISDDKKISITVPLVENNCAIEAESPDKNLKANYKPPKLDYRYRDNRPNDHSIISDKIGKIFNENENKKSLFSHVDAMENTIMPNITQNGERLSNVIKLGNKGSNNTEETSSPFKCFIPIGQMSVKEKGQQAYVEFEGRHDKDHGHIYRYRHCTANNE